MEIWNAILFEIIVLTDYLRDLCSTCFENNLPHSTLNCAKIIIILSSRWNICFFYCLVPETPTTYSIYDEKTDRHIMNKFVASENKSISFRIIKSMTEKK